MRTYSYGIYLLHQPHVISVGLRTRELSAVAFAVVAIATVAAVAVEGIVVEKAVNGLMGGMSARKDGQAARA